MKSVLPAIAFLPVTALPGLAHQSGAAHAHPHLIWPEVAAVAVVIGAIAALAITARKLPKKVRSKRHDPR